MSDKIVFNKMDLSEETLRAVSDMGFYEATPIQSESIRYIMQGFDIIGQSQTGTGKTAAFGIPCIEQIDPFERTLQAVVLCPTRELCIQVCDELRKLLKYHEGIKVVPVYGGQPIDKQIQSMKGGCQIVVGTPGRFMDHMRRHTLRLRDVTMVVLDEADEMLNMGFREDIELILSQMPKERQTIMFSATMPDEIRRLAETYQEDPKYIKTVTQELTVQKIEECYFDVKEKMKTEALSRLLEYYSPELTLVFCNTKKRVDELTRQLQERNYWAEALHGDLNQFQRDAVMKKFRSRTTDILVATDVAARGIDVDNIDIVVNYDIPEHEEYYVHRIGRTGRAGKTGQAYTFVVGRELQHLKAIMEYTGSEIEPRRLPTLGDLEKKRSTKFLDMICQMIDEGNLDRYHRILHQLQNKGYEPHDVAAALIKRELHVDEDMVDDLSAPPRLPEKEYDDKDMIRLHINIGSRQQIRAKDIVGAIAGETGIPGRVIGAIQIMDNFTFVDVPKDFVKDILTIMQDSQIKGKSIRIERAGENDKERSKDRKGNMRPRKASERKPSRGQGKR